MVGRHGISPLPQVWLPMRKWRVISFSAHKTDHPRILPRLLAVGNHTFRATTPAEVLIPVFARFLYLLSYDIMALGDGEVSEELANSTGT